MQAFFNSIPEPDVLISLLPGTDFTAEFAAHVNRNGIKRKEESKLIFRYELGFILYFFILFYIFLKRVFIQYL